MCLLICLDVLPTHVVRGCAHAHSKIRKLFCFFNNILNFVLLEPNSAVTLKLYLSLSFLSSFGEYN